MRKNSELKFSKQFTQNVCSKLSSKTIFLFLMLLFLKVDFVTAKELSESEQVQIKNNKNELSESSQNSEKLYDKIYVISLDRTPKRYSYVKKQLDRLNLKHERFSAVDGKLITVRDVERNRTIPWQKIGPPNGYYRNADLKISYHSYKDAEFHYITDKCLLNFGELGCTMSHRAVWSDIVKNKYKRAIILEDDVTLESNFYQKLSKTLNNLPRDFDVFFLDIAVRPHELNDIYFSLPDFLLSKFSNTSSPYYARIKPNNKDITGVHAYMMTLNSAKELLKKTEYIHVPIASFILKPP